MDKLIGQSIAKAFAVRADKFDIFRKVAIKGYDISFLITDAHLEKFEKGKIVDFIT
jgi:actin related protein 2/3 complex subunit 4